jgi:hypothetical protein
MRDRSRRKDSLLRTPTVWAERRVKTRLAKQTSVRTGGAKAE